MQFEFFFFILLFIYYRYVNNGAIHPGHINAVRVFTFYYIIIYLHKSDLGLTGNQCSDNREIDF